MNTVKIPDRCPKCQAPLPVDAPHGLCARCLLAAAATPTEAGQPRDTRWTPPSVETVAAAFPQLEVLQLIGVGGMGAVYKARQPKLDRFVALKVLPQTLAGDAAFAERFNREARVLARLSHPNIIAVFDFGQSGGFFYLLMEFVDGVNLRQAMKAGRFSPQQALFLVPKICEALQFAHDEGILHRDIKPENILLDTRGRVKIADFGIAKLIGEKIKGATLTASGMVVGTPHYMAPEQLEHPQDVDQRADIYSLGVVFYEMLTGELPIGRFAPPSQKTPVDPRVDAVVLQALEKERERRQHNAAEVKTEIEQITAIAPPAVAAVPPRTSLCYVSTPEYLRTFRARFLYIYQGKGELSLTADTLRFNSGWQAVIIPLASIRGLGLGQYPISAKVGGLNYLEVAFDEQGNSRTLFFTPTRRALRPGWVTNKDVEEWSSAVQKAVRAATGRTLPLNRSSVAPGHAWRELLKAFLLASILCSLVFALIPVITEHRVPDRLADYLPGPIVVAFALGSILAIRWRRHQSGVLAEAGLGRPLKPWERRWLERAAGARKSARAALGILTLLFGFMFLVYSIRYSEVNGQLVRHWAVGAGRPWLMTSQPNPGPGFLSGIEFNVMTVSFACGILALIVGRLTARLYRIEKASLPFATGVEGPESAGFAPAELTGFSGNPDAPRAWPKEPAAFRDMAAGAVPGVLRQGNCYYATPKRMRHSFPGPQAHIFQCRGNLLLEAETLAFVSPWQTRIVIPLREIHDASIGQFQLRWTPWVKNYARFNFLAVTFGTVNGPRTVCLTPVPPGRASPALINEQVAEWFGAVGKAVAALTGASPHVSQPGALVIRARAAWNVKGIPLMLAPIVAWLVGILNIVSTNQPSPVVTGATWFLALFFCLVLGWFALGFLKANQALRSGNLDEVTSDEPPDDPADSPGADESLSPGLRANQPRRPFWWTVSAWIFVGIGLLAVIDTLSSIYARPIHPTFYPGLAHLFAGIALLTYSRRWRIVALVALALAALAGTGLGIMMAVSPERALISLPALNLNVPVAEKPWWAAAAAVCLALVLVWPCYLLICAKARTLFGLAPKT
jgi:tRNA A-37 threonylcarbamoyl transferase component Bud32